MTDAIRAVICQETVTKWMREKDPNATAAARLDTSQANATMRSR